MILVLCSWLQRKVPNLLNYWASRLSFYGSQSSLFFFLRPACSLDVTLDPQYNIKQYDKIDFIHILNILLQDSGMCCIGFGPSHDVLQELLEVENYDDVWTTTKPIAINGRREDYVRLPFVDDLCLHSAMQDFLRRKPSSRTKLTGRQIRSS